MEESPAMTAEIVVDLAAIRHNVRTLRELVAPAALMTVVKADGYGHGMVEAARAAREGGADWLGVATVEEALALRVAGDTGRLLCWLDVPGVRYAEAVAADVDLTVYSTEELTAVVAAAGARVPRVQVKVDTGLTRGGAPREDWPDLFAALADLERGGTIRVTGIWSHFACSDEPAHPANDAQQAAFDEALALADRLGLHPEVRHLANSAAAILRSSARYDLVRCGIASYGLDPAPGVTPDLGLVPAMTARAELALSKPVAAGAGVSYGHTWIADRATSVGLVPMGYGDGVPRHASNRAEALLTGRRRPLRGRVCMDQFLVDLDGELPPPGTEVVLWGTGADGGPTAQDWAEACDTISYEIVCRIGGRLSRRYVDERATR